MDEISVLQLGTEDWSEIYAFPESIDFYYVDRLEKPSKKLYDIVFIDRELDDKEIEQLSQITKAYALFVTEHVEMTKGMLNLYKCKKGQKLYKDDIQQFLLNEAADYYPKPYGEKFKPSMIAISQNFNGSIKWNGNCNVALDGDYGEEFNQIIYWRNNIPIYKGQSIDLWLEYQKDKEVSLVMRVTQFQHGYNGKILKTWEFTEEDLHKAVIIDNQIEDGLFFISLFAKGKGKLQVAALHDRYSRKNKGHFLPGGERYVTSNREEVFCYFDPGDLKPPFNVYFSGYKTREGFEGYNLMRNMKCPFLLISEARLEGGGFYVGSEEYENLIINCIKKYMNELGFSSNQVILSGLSMGTFGALYYGCDIRPFAMIVGKPLASLGNMAANEKRFRPGGFPTSLDLLKYNCGDTDENAIKKLNDIFWNKFDSTDWGKSKFIISYMIEDDYDATAYDTLISHIQSEGVQVYGKGVHGRHNDNTGVIVSWFSSQFEKILNEDFARRIDK